MHSLEYSNEALEAKGLFYNKEAILFVEGIDDPLFWDTFIKTLDLNVHIEDVGGNEEIEKIINKILDEDAKIYVALDRNYIDFFEDDIKDKYFNERILLTYGHSIENTLYHPVILNEVIKSYVKKANFDKKDEIIAYIKSFENDIKTLLIIDIISNKIGASTKVIGDSCVRHLKDNSSVELCIHKINEYLEDLNLNFHDELKNEIDLIINNSQKSIFNIIKGHFLTSFIINMIRLYVKKIRQKDLTITNENLYTAVIDKIRFIENLEEYNHYIKECSKINNQIFIE